MSQRLRVGVVGGGSFATVLAQLAAYNRQEVCWWMRSGQQRERIQASLHNPKCPQFGTIPASISLCSALPELLERSQLLILALPAAAVAECLLQLKPCLRADHQLVSAAKGIAAPPLQSSAQLLEQHTAELGLAFGVLSGPNIAAEIAAKHISGSVIASACPQLRAATRAALERSYLRIFESEDCYGVELGGILKNIYAIVAGIVDSLQFGANSKALLLVRAMAEMLRLAEQLGVRGETFFGLAGMGDLLATSISANSRNYQLGCLLAQGHDLASARTRLPGVAEGVRTLEMVHAYARAAGVNMPLAEGLHQVLFQSARLRPTFWRLLKRTPTLDVEVKL